MLPITSAEPSTALAVLCFSITAALAAGLPAARWYAGTRAGEPREDRGRATMRTGLGVLVWIALTGGLAGAGVLDHFDRFPPPVLPVFLLGFVVVFVAAFSKFGKTLADHLPLAVLIGYQGFRVAVEIMLHQAATEGVIGEQMTWSGLNFDVVSGATAVVLGLWLWRRSERGEPVPRAVVWAWNVLGLALLLTIVSIAVMSIPGPLRAFDGPPNVWVATVPFIWLPVVMVTAALFGHLLVFRWLLAKRSA